MRLRLNFSECGGDTVVSTAAVASLKLLRPSWSFYVSGAGSEVIYAGNGLAEAWDGQETDKTIEMINPLVQECHERPWHFLHSYCATLSAALGFNVPLAFNRPQLRLHEDEGPIVDKPYWLVSQPGAKDDYTIKRWSHRRLCEVVKSLPMRWVQVGEAHHAHKPIPGALDLIGKTDLRQLMRLVAHASGVLTGESLCHHLAAAFAVPSVTLCASWLPASWISYPSATLLGRWGCLPCCRERACWMARVVPCKDTANPLNRRLCRLPVVGQEEEPMAACMAMISVEEVVNAVLQIERGKRMPSAYIPA